MNNIFYEAILSEKEPMYDLAVESEKGIDLWRAPSCNNANNSHSVTKMFISVAIGQLWDAGKISLDDKVTAFFKKECFPEDMDEKWNLVSVDMALRHLTGIDTIPYGVDNDDDIEKIGKDYLKYVFSLKIEHEPGTFYKYSDAAYYLLGRIIHSVTGLYADEYLKINIFDPLSFRQWAMAKCPMGHPICGGGFFARSDDTVKLGFCLANGGVYNEKRIVSKEYVDMAMQRDYACTRFRRTSIFLKTGAQGQIVAFSKEKKIAASWHGASTDGGGRNDRLLIAFAKVLGEDYND